VSFVAFAGIAADPPGCPPWWEYGSGVPEWPTRAPACGASTGQSPVNVPPSGEVATERLTIHYQSITRKIKNTARTAQIDVVDPNNYVSYGGENFVLQEIHFHTPSEHTHGNAEHDAMEAHLLNKSTAGNILVVAVLFNRGGTSSEALRSIISTIPGKCLTSTREVTFTPRALVPWRGVDATPWTTYVGSKTTPDCDPRVRFVIMSERMQVSDTDWKIFHDMFGDNIRPTFPFGNRTVEVHRAKK